jgi:demethylmenaquinone methyltransferase/2-methoxy-6-polyprenyl-1,4-benzoquinol methylase
VIAPEAGRIREAQSIFEGVAGDYDTPAQIFGLGRYRAWHRELAALVAAAKPARVLDMCTGTGAIATEIAARTTARVVAVDITRGMLARARKRPGLVERDVAFVQAAAQAPPFADGSFDVVVFSYLLRYVADVPGTIAALCSGAPDVRSTMTSRRMTLAKW